MDSARGAAPCWKLCWNLPNYEFINLFYTPQIVTAFVCTDNITLGYCTRWIRPEGPRHVEKTSRGWSCAVTERAHGKEHGDAHECSKIYVLKYTECHPPVYRLIHGDWWQFIIVALLALYLVRFVEIETHTNRWSLSLYLVHHRDSHQSVLYQGFQLLGIAWREKRQMLSARTHEWGPGPPIGPLMGSRGKAHNRGPRRRPLL